ncbi:ORF917 [White spot syndrome virus]|uniref:Wsv388 n=3 Tax=White spot syndrome virus TaxID=342409 RepID=Q8VAL4_WSSVS|nr:wsv388 [Shrimp white spot syndrome virus]AFX59765.1 wsv388 [White spot syndrome virus]AAL33390.1 wsv388 [Shrimp white spot syndrome virus]AAL89315.1 WSSV447 [Shrimp white spot syndrome virus]ATU83864.1 ORF917 [White spot syndrome virus]AWQ60513.1 wsv388 [Shrimp white spot syndrome virus]
MFLKNLITENVPSVFFCTYLTSGQDFNLAKFIGEGSTLKYALSVKSSNSIFLWKTKQSCFALHILDAILAVTFLSKYL